MPTSTSDSCSNSCDSFIVYACPVGELEDQLDAYFQQSMTQCGPNAAHAYMPHCTLTGFFRDEATIVPLYIQALDRALHHAQPCPDPVIVIKQLTFRPDWHGLELQSDWLKQVMVHFAGFATSPTRSEALRLKNWLHLSLAYEFQPDQSDALMQLAQDYINIQASVQWELRFYQRHANHRWTCHQSWVLNHTIHHSTMNYAP